MDEIRIVGPGKTRGYLYPVCKKRIVGPGKTRVYPYPVCKKWFSFCPLTDRVSRRQSVWEILRMNTMLNKHGIKVD